MTTPKKSNSLIYELSPYLLQHAYNPVDWIPWKEETLLEIKKGDKLLLISIGYASCHWCHVMEEHVFEDENVAKLMNQNFVNIKVDREERPDIDAVYMNALQMIKGQGGWPLNIIALPNGIPIWGGTYLPKTEWMDVLTNLSTIYKEKPKVAIEYADNLKRGLEEINKKSSQNKEVVSLEEWSSIFNQLEKRFDVVMGGMMGAPKFMMPSLLRLFYFGEMYFSLENTYNQFHLTLQKMALGGICDQIEGGFSRYSVDDRWHIPHFEKMGYDNGQLLSLYSLAYQDKKDVLYEMTVSDLVFFLKNKLLSPEGGFYSSLDADSENSQGKLEEGAFYVWKIPELKGILGEDFSLFQKYFSIDEEGYWEDEKFVLYRKSTTETDTEISKEKVQDWKKRLFEEREKRLPPRLDDKIICSWNALISSGLLEAYRVFKKEEYLKLATENILFIDKHLLKNNELFRIFKNGASKTVGFLEDYAAVIKLFIDYYETVFEEKWLYKAFELTDYVIANFQEGEKSLFSFSMKKDLIVNTKETNDNVIPSSNAVMTENLFRLSKHNFFKEYETKAMTLWSGYGREIKGYPESHSYWLSCYITQVLQPIEIVVTGQKAIEIIREIQSKTKIQCTWAASEKPSDLPLFKGRIANQQTMIYFCRNKQCEYFETSVEKIIEKIEKLEVQ